MPNKFSGQGRRRPLLDLSVDQLHLDTNNPRLPEDVQGRSEEQVLESLKRVFDLEELAYSLSENGYFDEEPLVAIPQNLPKQFKKKDQESLNQNKEYINFINNPNTGFIVVEGNRRLATIRFLLNEDLRKRFNVRTWPTLSSGVREDLRKLPVIIYPERDGVLQYLGVRHITGIKKWESFAKARYIAYLIKQRFSIDEIQASVGDRSNSVRKIYLCYRLVEIAQEEFDADIKKIESFFSYLLLATGQGSVKEYLGIPRSWGEINFNNPIPKKKIENLKNLFSWIFGEGKDKQPVISESRDITNYLSPILSHKMAVQHLITTRNLAEAYERTDAEEKLVENYLRKANLNLEKALGLIHRHKTDAIKEEVSKIKETLKVMLKIYEG